MVGKSVSLDRVVEKLGGGIGLLTASTTPASVLGIQRRLRSSSIAK